MLQGRYSFIKQANLLCQAACNRAFGLVSYSLPIYTPTLQQLLSPSYKISIARQVYNTWLQEGFKYADQGITPQAIAEQIQVHIKSTSKSKSKSNYKHNGDMDMNWHIDQFGNFIFSPTQGYLNKIKDTIINKGQYQHVDTVQWECYNAQKQKIKQIHYFDYYVGEQMAIKDVRKILNMQSKAKVLEQINKQKVIRTIFRENMKDMCKENIQIVKGILCFLDGSRLQIQQYSNIQNITQKRLTQNKKQQIFQYFGCDGYNTIHFSKMLPFHILDKQFLGNQQNLISKLTSQQLISRINQQPKDLFLPQIDKKLFIKRKPNLKEFILFYGNLLDQFKFRQIQCLLEIMRETNTKKDQTNQYELDEQNICYEILKQTCNKIRKCEINQKTNNIKIYS